MTPFVDLFVSIQGEGKYMGVPSIFIRVSGCNLRCVFKDSICDTPYSSFRPEASKYTVEEIIDFVKQNERISHVVITGGEPLLYGKDDDFKTLIKGLNKLDKFITIETNGTQPMLDPLNYKIGLYSVSPKMGTSVGKPGKYGDYELTQHQVDRHNADRINIEVLTNIALFSNDYQFKFVYSGKETVEEIEDLYKRMAKQISKEEEYIRMFYFKNHPNKHTMLMPEGITNDAISKYGQEIVDECIKRGWQYTDRLHIRLFGDKRGK